jgi:hypothetical protein
VRRAPPPFFSLIPTTLRQTAHPGTHPPHPSGINCEDNPPTKTCPSCDTSDPKYNCSAPSEGPGIHPRLKVPVGQRLAHGALIAAYNFPGPLTGPTVSGCTLTNTSLTVTFSVSGGAMFLKSNGGGAKFSGFSALVGESAPGAGNGQWVALNISQVGATSAISVDVSPLAGHAIQAIKYAWGPTGGAPNGDDVTCCVDRADKECLPAECPIFVASALAPYGGLPANPFLAQITEAGKCACPAPQVCND